MCWPPLHASDYRSKALRHLEIASVGKLRKCWVQKDKLISCITLQCRSQRLSFAFFLSLFFFWRRTECRCVWKCLYLCTWLNICVIHQVCVLVWCDKTSFYFLQIAVAEEEKEVVVWKQINNISECSTSAVSRLFLTLTLQSLFYFFLSFFFAQLLTPPPSAFWSPTRLLLSLPSRHSDLPWSLRRHRRDSLIGRRSRIDRLRRARRRAANSSEADRTTSWPDIAGNREKKHLFLFCLFVFLRNEIKWNKVPYVRLLREATAAVNFIYAPLSGEAWSCWKHKKTQKPWKTLNSNVLLLLWLGTTAELRV